MHEGLLNYPIAGSKGGTNMAFACVSVQSDPYFTNMGQTILFFDPRRRPAGTRNRRSVRCPDRRTDAGEPGARGSYGQLRFA